MSERKRARAASSASSPLATVDDIQRRLRRPPSASSPPPKSTFSTPPEDRRAQIQKHSSESKLRTTNYKLEDYLDLNLLAEASSTIGRRKKGETTTSGKKEVGDFEWPANELKVLVVDESNKGAVSLNNDLDLTEGFGDGDVETCTAFGRFERSAIRRFRR